jgi:mRNA interferase HicA
LSYSRVVRGAEFLRKIKALGAARGIPVRLEEKRGKGSHAMLYFGNARTILQDVKRELPSGTFRAMLRQLGLTPQDLEER